MGRLRVKLTSTYIPGTRRPSAFGISISVRRVLDWGLMAREVRDTLPS